MTVKCRTHGCNNKIADWRGEVHCHIHRQGLKNLDNLVRGMAISRGPKLNIQPPDRPQAKSGDWIVNPDIPTDELPEMKVLIETDYFSGQIELVGPGKIEIHDAEGNLYARLSSKHDPDVSHPEVNTYDHIHSSHPDKWDDNDQMFWDKDGRPRIGSPNVSPETWGISLRDSPSLSKLQHILDTMYDRRIPGTNMYDLWAHGVSNNLWVRKRSSTG